MDFGLTRIVMFRVTDAELPFDAHYTANVSISNFYDSAYVEMPLSLSKYNILVQ